MFHKHLGLTLDKKSNFSVLIKYIIQKISKIMGLMRKVQPTLPRLFLLISFKKSVRNLLDYANIYYQAYNCSFHEKLESIQYNAFLAITGAMRGTSTETYREKGLESLKLRLWFRKLCQF